MFSIRYMKCGLKWHAVEHEGNKLGVLLNLVSHIFQQKNMQEVICYPQNTIYSSRIQNQIDNVGLDLSHIRGRIEKGEQLQIPGGSGEGEQKRNKVDWTLESIHFHRGPSTYGITYQLIVYMLVVLLCSRTK